MDKALKAELAVLGDEVRAAAIPSACKDTALWCIGQLPALYAKFRQTSESRYGEEITRLLQGVIKELAKSTEAQTVAANMTDRFRLFHEQFGLPGPEFKAPAAAKPRPRKAR